jgi:hypothetical protein
MQISNLIPGFADKANVLTKHAATTATVAGGTLATAATSSTTNPATTALRQILAKYDVTDISPNDFSTMIQSLYNNGSISKTDFQNLSSLRSEVQASGVQPDEQINLLDYYRQQVQNAQAATANPSDTAAQQQIAPMLQRLGWLEKFAAGHAQPETIGLSTLA